MKSLFIIFVSVLVFNNAMFAQTKIDSTVKPDETTFYDGPANTIFTPGFLLATRSKNYYQLTGKQKQANKVPNPTVNVYKDKKKYQIVIQGLEPITAVKLRDVVESNIEGSFKGWDGTTSFTLTNGDTWVQDELKTLFSPTVYRPVVYIFTGSDGNYKMKVAGVEETLQVKKK